jgi:hypothetical protein
VLSDRSEGGGVGPYSRLKGSSNFHPSSFLYSRPFSRAFLDKSQSIPLCRLALPPLFQRFDASGRVHRFRCPTLPYSLIPYLIPQPLSPMSISQSPRSLPHAPTTLIKHGGQKTIRDPKHSTTHHESYTYISTSIPTTTLPHTFPIHNNASSYAVPALIPVRAPPLPNPIRNRPTPILHIRSHNLSPPNVWPMAQTPPTRHWLSTRMGGTRR